MTLWTIPPVVDDKRLNLIEALEHGFNEDLQELHREYAERREAVARWRLLDRERSTVLGLLDVRAAQLEGELNE